MLVEDVGLVVSRLCFSLQFSRESCGFEVNIEAFSRSSFDNS